MKKKIIIILLYLFVLIMTADPLKFEGYVEGQFGALGDADEFDWNIWDPNITFEGRFYSKPLKDSEMYFKFYSDKDNDEYKSGNSTLAVRPEGHISFRKEKSSFGFETILFTRESGRYWMDGSMLDLLNVDSVKDGDNGQGVRWDFWAPSSSFTYIISDYSSGSGDDVHLARFRQSLFDNDLRLGMTYQRKNKSFTEADNYNHLFAGDIKYQLGRYYISWELAGTASPAEEELNDKLDEYIDSGELKDFFKQNLASRMEVSGLRLGSTKSGFLAFTPGAYFYGDCYKNDMGNNDDSNKYGWWINSYYLLPQRAITITCNYSEYEKQVPDTLIIDEKEIISYNPVKNLYSEAYVEFIKGFKWKIAFNKKDDVWQGTESNHYDLFTELQVENRLAKLMTQFKIKDLGEIEEKQIWGIECSVNLADRWRIFTRGMVANDRGGSRFSIFGEISYKVGGNTEAYLQYGPSQWGQYGLVNDNGFASSGEMKEELKLIVKSWF